MNYSTMPSQELIARLSALRIASQEDYATCKRLAQPLIDELNSRGEKIAKKYAKHYKKISFLGFPIISR